MKPTIGRIVHYHPVIDNNLAEVPRVTHAAIVTSLIEGDQESNAGMVWLQVFSPTGIYVANAPQADVPRPGFWCWPPRA